MEDALLARARCEGIDRGGHGIAVAVVAAAAGLAAAIDEDGGEGRLPPGIGCAVDAAGGTLVLLFGRQHEAVMGAKRRRVAEAHAHHRPASEPEKRMAVIEGGAMAGGNDEFAVLGVADLGPVDGERLAGDHPARALVFRAGIAAEHEAARGYLDQRVAGDGLARACRAGRGEYRDGCEE